MKFCFKCNVEKPIYEFYKHSKMADGHLNKCKDCSKLDARNHRFGPRREHVLEYDRKRATEPHRLIQQKIRSERYKQENQERDKAKNALNNAVKNGKIKKLPCWVCGSQKVEGHHPSYSLPLDVVWLCSAHHHQLHAEAKLYTTT